MGEQLGEFNLGEIGRVLTSVEWEQKFPLVMVRAIQRGLFDHTPLIVDSGDAVHLGNKNIFSFELSWFEERVSLI